MTIILTNFVPNLSYILKRVPILSVCRLNLSHIFCVKFTQFEIVDARDHTNVERLKNKSTYLVKDADGAINGKPTYARILIRRRA